MFRLAALLYFGAGQVSVGESPSRCPNLVEVLVDE